MIRLENVSKYYNDGNKTSIGISNINLRFNEKRANFDKRRVWKWKNHIIKNN